MIKQLTAEHTQQFCDLIINMYSNLENLEWFSPMPFDYDNVKGMIENNRFYIIGYFKDDFLCGVGSVDYKCGKLIGKIDLPEECDTTKLVELGFSMVHSDYRGNGLMKEMIDHLINKLKNDGYEWAFGKVHVNNFASSKSLIKKGFSVYSPFTKPVNVADFVSLSSAPFFSKIGKQNAKQTLSKVDANAEKLFVNYNILIKKL